MATADKLGRTTLMVSPPPDRYPWQHGGFGRSADFPIEAKAYGFAQPGKTL